MMERMIGNVRVMDSDLINQIPDNLNLDVDSFVRKLEKQIRHNEEESTKFGRLVKTRLDKDTDSFDSADPELPTAFKTLSEILNVTRSGIGNHEAIFFLRGLAMQMVPVFDWLERCENELTDVNFDVLLESIAEINWAFEIYQYQDPRGFNLPESGIPTFLNVLSLFVIGEDVTLSVQNERTRVAIAILRRLRAPALQLCVLRHLIFQVQGCLNRMSLSINQDEVISSQVLNWLFSFLYLLQDRILDPNANIKEEDIEKLKSIEHVSSSEFPALPVISAVVGNFVRIAADILDK